MDDNGESLNSAKDSDRISQFIVDSWLIFLIGIITIFLLLRRSDLFKRSSDQAVFQDPEAALRKLEAMEAARKRMQEKYSMEARAFAEKQKEKAEAKRRELLEELEKYQSGGGNKTKGKSEEPSDSLKTKPSTTKPRLRPDYNPLMGYDGSSGFRSSRRGPSAGG
ncbi:selenoprotein S-like [Artemia franciscana]|uniref:selenoprotein S-like n=1 Tax=Artemia franciscana TaxID=6661 RepID=UPI0032DAB946